MDWTTMCLACKRVWAALLVLEESGRTFAKSGTVKSKQLKFWVPGSSSAARRARARSLSRQMDNIFTVLNGATYEPGVERNQAVKGMVAVLMDADKTMHDLAVACEDSYVFL